jgi:hydroxyacylglutathione hydrolase
MARVHSFIFSPFAENTYVIYDDTKECVIVDPGCYDATEQEMLRRFIEQHRLKPVRLLNTHAHLDHVFGNKFVAEAYGLGVEIHKGELPLLEFAPRTAAMYGLAMSPSPEPKRFIEAGERLRFGNTELEAILTPGHSPASLSFFCPSDNFLLAGDTLFRMSIGRTDLPGGDYETLLASIRDKLFPLGDDVVVYPGHERHTTIGYERRNNPFLKPLP